jgi:hypothetical protein
MGKTHYKKLRNPNYLGSWDLYDTGGNRIEKTFQITGVKKEVLHDGNGGTSDGMVVMLKDSKPFVCNSTNAKRIAKLVGSSFIEDWVKFPITLKIEEVKAFGQVMDAIRVSTKNAVNKLDIEVTKKVALCNTVDELETLYKQSSGISLEVIELFKSRKKEIA